MTEQPIREVRPVVVPAQFFVVGPIAAAFLAVFPAGFVFMLHNIAADVFSDPFAELEAGPRVGLALAAYVLAFGGFLALFAVKVYTEPGRTLYRIFPDRIEYAEGLWNRVRRTVIFDQVIDVELTESVLQQTRGAGTVTLITQQLVSEGEGKLSNRRIALENVPAPRAVYDLIRSLALKKG